MARRSDTRTRHPRGGAGTGLRGTDTDTLGVIGVICAVAGFFVWGILLGPVAAVLGWLGMGRRWSGAKPLLPLIALVLGALDTLISLLYMTQ